MYINHSIRCTRRRFIGSLFVTLLLILIIAAIILALLLKSRSTKTTKISNTTIPILRWNKTGITVAGIAGNPGNASNQLNIPVDIILDYENNLYVADRDNHRIQKFLYGSSIGQTIAGNGVQGSTQYQLNSPNSVVLDSDRNLYISDTNNHRIQFYRNGNNLGQTVAGVTGSPGTSANQLNSPHDIAFHPTSNIFYVSNYGAHSITSHVFGSNSSLLVFGSQGLGTNTTQLNYPDGLYFDSFSNSLVIVNHLAHNVVQYVFGSTEWTLLAGNMNGTPGSTSTSFIGPTKSILDPMGNMYIADRNNQRIQFFPGGQLNGSTIAGVLGLIGINATTMYWPWSVILDNQLNLYVADANNHRIQKFLRY